MHLNSTRKITDPISRRRYGRKLVCLIGMFSMVAFGVIGYFSPNIEFFLAQRFLTGVAYGLFQSTSLCLFVEAVGPEYRSLVSLSFLGTSGLGMMLLAGVAYVTKDWRTLQLVGFVPIALISPLLIWRFVPETPRWLLSAGKYAEAEKVILEAAKMNGIEIMDKDGIMKELKSKVEEEKKSEARKKRATILDLFRTGTLRKMTIILWSALLLVAFINTGFTLTVGQLGGSLHLNYFLIGLTEALSTGVLLLEAKYMSRRGALLINLVVSGISFFAAIAIPDSLVWLQISVGILGKTCVTIGYTLLWLFSAEIFPTNLRVVGVSGGMTLGRIGNVVASFMDELGRQYGKNVPIAIYGSLSVLTSLIFLLLPETRDQHLPDTVKESERLKETMDVKT